MYQISLSQGPKNHWLWITVSLNHEKMFVWNTSIWVGGPCSTKYSFVLFWILSMRKKWLLKWEKTIHAFSTIFKIVWFPKSTKILLNMWGPLVLWTIRNDFKNFFEPIVYVIGKTIHDFLHLSWIDCTDYERSVRKSPSLHSQKSTRNPKFLGMAEAYFVCRIGPNFQIYDLIGCP